MLRLAREVIPTLPRTLNIMIAGLNAPPVSFVPDQHHFQPGYALVITGFGFVEEHDQVLARIREALPPLFGFVTPMPYVALQQMLDESNAWGFHCYDKGTYIEDLSDAAIEVITEQLPRKSSPLSLLLFYRLDEAYSEVGENDSAFSGGRSPRFAVFIIGVCPTPELLVADRAWVRSFWDALRPYTPGIGSYVNTMTEVENDRVCAAYGPAKYERLTKIKNEYDPGNVFHHNVNIKPASAPPDARRADLTGHSRPPKSSQFGRSGSDQGSDQR